MTAARSVPANGYPSPPEPGLTPQEVVARAKRNMSTLHSHAGVSIFLASVANRELVFDVVG